MLLYGYRSTNQATALLALNSDIGKNFLSSNKIIENNPIYTKGLFCNALVQ